MLCALLCETTPLTCTCWPTLPARSTELFPLSSQVLPSVAVSRYSLALPDFVRHPLMVLTSPLEFASESCALTHAERSPTKSMQNSKRLRFLTIAFPPLDCPAGQ